MILNQILEEKFKEVEELKHKYQNINLIDFIEKYHKLNQSRSFYHSLKQSRKGIIAECKKASPSMGIIKEDYNPVFIAKQYESLGATAISVLTDKKFFLGSIEDLNMVSNNVSIPLLRKDFIISKEQILEAKINGASAVLLIVRILKPDKLRELLEFSELLGLDCLVEVHNEKEIEIALKYPVKIIGINHRDLDTLKMQLDLSFKLAPEIKKFNKDILIIAESGIEEPEKIEVLYNIVDGFLIGTYFMKSNNIKEVWQRLFSKVLINVQE